ncbi:hypothetical protein HPB50_023018 [Hyalomma asiaticum]|uniref:Uncharacterized protein n=1 Tax=Hyalomma asiaticum TaxID=266040 RepID=A0ACB7SAX6_HYAAI|nr:hypothetical protein HPB50_023018 [Hyalomma asiaticum]
MERRGGCGNIGGHVFVIRDDGGAPWRPLPKEGIHRLSPPPPCPLGPCSVQAGERSAHHTGPAAPYNERAQQIRSALSPAEPLDPVTPGRAPVGGRTVFGRPGFDLNDRGEQGLVE